MKSPALPRLFLAALLLLPGAAAACCTAVLCPYCVSSGGQCTGDRMPACNVFGCNCSSQCGAYTAGTDLQCYFSAACDSEAARIDAQARFSEVDGNKDGAISRDETRTWTRKQKNPPRIDPGVLPAVLQAGEVKEEDITDAAFARADADGNGAISPAEFDSSLEAAAPSN